MISNLVADEIYVRFWHLLRDLDQPWLSRPNPQIFANAVHEKGAALDDCWGFIDGTVRPICRPQRNQRLDYNGHKRVHAIKFQSVVAPNGLANLYWPVEGRRQTMPFLQCLGFYHSLNSTPLHQMVRSGSVHIW